MRIVDEVTKRAEEEMYNEDAVRAEMEMIYRQLESGAIGEEEFGRREAELVARLEAIENHRKRRRNRG